MDKNLENNNVVLAGRIAGEFKLNHEMFGEKFYIADLEAERESGVSDFVPIMVSDRLVDVKREWSGKYVSVNGQFRSFNRHEGDNHKLVLSVFVEEMEILEGEKNENVITLDGFICREPVYRTTPLGREITDILLAVNRSYGKSDYIPCICWGRNARFVSMLNVGTRLQIKGRIQSRNYIKRLPDGLEEERVAYEVSASRLEVPEDEE